MPTPDDELALLGALDALRKMPRDLLSVTSTELTMDAARVSQAGADPKARILFYLARVLYVLAEEDKHPQSAR